MDFQFSAQILVLQRGTKGSNWTLGAPELQWPLQVGSFFATQSRTR